MKLKAQLLQIHRWTGLVVAVFVLAQATTGSMLVFRHQLAQAIDPAGMVRRTAAGEAAPLSRIVAQVRARYPGFELQRIVFPQVPSGTYFVHLTNPQGVIRYASVDPGDGAVLRAGGIFRFPTEAALLIHYQLLAGRAGIAVVSLVGLSILTMAVTGLISWWPRPGAWRRGLRIDWSLPARVVLRQVHRAVGPWVAIVVTLSALTGLVLAIGLLARPGAVRSTDPSGLPPVSDAPIDRAFAMAQQAFPGRGVRDVRMPQPGAFNVFFWAPEVSPAAVNGVRITLDGPTIISTAAAREDTSLPTAALPIHAGASLGFPGQVAILFGGLGLVLLAVSGPLMWFQARRKKPAGGKP